MNNFVSIDFETANFERSSVCSVGLVAVKDGERSPLRRKPLLPFHRENAPRPVPNYYNARCQEVHGLGPCDTNNAPEFPEVWADVQDWIHQFFPYMEDGEVPFVAHNKAFDENCLKAVFAAYAEVSPMKRGNRLPAEGATISGRRRNPLRRRPLLPFRRENAPGYIAGYCGYDLKNHHHALADAEACAVIAMQIL